MWAHSLPAETNRETRSYVMILAGVVLAALLLAVSGTAAAGGSPVAEVNGSVGPDDGTNLTIIQYNDIQTAMADNESMARLVGAINDRKAALDNPTLVVGGGDEVSPSSLSAVSEWRVPIDALNVLNPAAEGLGNHDLDYGFDPVANFSAESEFPWLVANIQAEDGGNVPGTQNYTMVERGGVTIGILGLVDDAIDPKTAVDFEEEGYQVTDWSAAGRQVAATLKEEENADVVVALTHTGVLESKEIANNTENIDAIVTGDDEVLYEPQVTSGTVIVEAGGEATHLGEVNLSVDDGAVGFNDGRLYDLGAGDWSMNETADEVVQAGRTEDLAQVAGEATESLDSTFGNYADDTGWGRVIGDAFLAQTGADVAMTNAGGIRGNFMIEAGELTYDDIYTSLPFGNTLVTKAMTGQQIVDYLSRTAAPFDNDFGVQPELQVGGLTYEVVDRPDPEQTVKDVYVQGEPIDLRETYEVAVNSYMAGGPMLSEMETVDEDLTLYGTAVVNYVEGQGTITTPEEDRIRRTTRMLGEPDISLDGDMATLEYQVPDAVASIEASSFTLLNESTGQLAVESIELDGDTLRLSANQEELVSLSEHSDTVELYGTYNDSVIDDQRNGFDTSRLNGDATISEATLLENELADVRATLESLEEDLVQKNEEIADLESQLSDRETEISDLESQLDEKDERIADLESQLDEKDEQIADLESDSSEADSDGPGFTPVVAVLAVLGAALLAVRRRE
ncbi:5'-nucleotidase C-terminal domain-containing protein [Halovenus salina]|uniref:5'-nucleotidase C-terminal domain-containing protein n=1 Tax=Halovenus salina TaxID=1510225 RepID=A0ABD5W6L4_9EURY|nr:5'-nucleotidase C-terminal domain-containing protein [Halovenus salina]